jgi:anti-sigma regulatory factor (Ser/Thr protein kinase)
LQVVAEGQNAADGRDVSLTIPARPDYLVLARLALSAVCRLTPLSAEEVADLKLAITEAANDFVDDGRSLDDESRVNFNFRLLDDRLHQLVEANGTTVGLPDLRAGQTVHIRRLGARFSGKYFVTKTTHTLDDNGYRTKFTAQRIAPLDNADDARPPQ